MTASKNDALYAAAKALFYKSSDEEIRMRCLDREEYYADLRNYERAISEMTNDVETYRKALLEKEQELKQNSKYYESQIFQLRSEIERLKKQ